VVQVSSSFSLVSTGDFAPLHPLKDSQGRVREVWEYLRSADLTIINLELPLTTASTPADKAITLRADPGIAPSLREAGVDVATVANNHALDYGAAGLLETMEVMKSAGVVPVGGGTNLENALRPAQVSVGGFQVAVFGLASTLPPGFAAGSRRSGIAPVRALSRFRIDSTTLDEQPGISPWVETETVEEDVRRACEQVSKANATADLIVVQIHWGIPNGWVAAFQGPLADYQRPLAHSLIDAGADLIIGHHPHTVHGIERFGHGLIAYSLGNFLFHSMGEDEELVLADSYPPYNLASLGTGEAMETVLLEVQIEDGRMKEVRFQPLRMNSNGEPEFVDRTEVQPVLRRLAEQSSNLGTSVEVESGAAVMRL
jgi:poly-gamma-glutamate capsule biosynthesis protein CapA/YwtB (metallophosphatase superfamily)